MRTPRPVRAVTSHTPQLRATATVMSDTDAVSVARLISLVKERPVLWDRQEEVYKNRKLTRQAWAEICEALIDNYHDLGEHEKLAIGRSIIGKWANLRDNWLRYWRKRQELLRVGSSTKSLKKYIHHDQLLFLSKVYDPEGQQEVEEIQVEVDVISDAEFEATLEFDERSQNSWTAQYPPLSVPTPPQDQSERHLYFFHSIMPMICDFDDDQVLEFHAGVLEWIKRVKRREFLNLQNWHSPCRQGVQEPIVIREGCSKTMSKAATQSNWFCYSTQQRLIKEEKCSDIPHTIISNSVIPESTNNSKMTEGSGSLTEDEVKQKVSFDKSDFVSLKDVVTKLEKISGTLGAQVVEDSQDQILQNINSLLRQLSPKKIQSLKRKIVKEMVREGFKKVKVESTTNYFETEKSESLDLNLNTPHTYDISERKADATITPSSSDEKEASPSILRDTLQNIPLDPK